jgi:hypothetical protein
MRFAAGAAESLGWMTLQPEGSPQQIRRYMFSASSADGI